MKYQTAESVTLGHPDKAADFVADCILDAVLAQDPDSRVACEVLLTHETMVVAGEITTKAKVNYQEVAEEALTIACADAPPSYLEDIKEQSPDIKQAVDETKEKRQGAGDQGIVYGYATNETPEMLPLPVVMAHFITEKLDTLRNEDDEPELGPDGKAQVTIAYDDITGKPVEVDNIVISIQHPEEATEADVEEVIADRVLKPLEQAFIKEVHLDNTTVRVNPSGRFTVGGFKADTGLTGRKLMVDTYGGIARHGGGALSGKDPSKTDRSGAYIARWLAKHIVASGLAERVEVGLAFAIGEPKPVMVSIDTFKTGEVSDNYIALAVKKGFDLSPEGIEKRLGLKTFRGYEKTAAEGHFINQLYPWERIDENASALLFYIATKMSEEKYIER